MARRPRFDLAEVAQHVVQRGNNRLPCFVAHPGDYPWSSHGANAAGRRDPLLVPHPAYLALGADGPARTAAWRALVAEGLSDEQGGEIRAHLQQQKVQGSDRFQDWVALRTGLFAGVRPRGRPPAKDKCP